MLRVHHSHLHVVDGIYFMFDQPFLGLGYEFDDQGERVQVLRYIRGRRTATSVDVCLSRCYGTDERLLAVFSNNGR